MTFLGILPSPGGPVQSFTLKLLVLLTLRGTTLPAGTHLGLLALIAEAMLRSALALLMFP